MAPKRIKKELHPAKVFARVRPFDASGKGGHTAGGEDARKTIETFDETSVTIDDQDRREKVKFDLTQVIQPAADQGTAFATSMVDSGLLKGFHTDTNVLFYAYGQTGSGKTHTMLGINDSLKAPEPNEGWGLFPRVVHSTLEMMEKSNAAGGHCILTVCAVEFYCMSAFDLDSKPKGPVVITAEAKIFGATQTRLNSVSDLAEYLPRVFGNRYTAKTRMNDASSRSHCALVLTLHQVDKDDKYTCTTFSMVDLAGSERNDKTGAGDKVNGNAAATEAYEMYKKGTPEKLSLAAQGFMINFELSFVQTEILKAGQMHSEGKEYRAQKAMSTAGVIYMTSCCDGRARLGMIVCLSPSPQHGFESWFTLKYADALMKLKAPLVKQKSVGFAKALNAAGVAATKAQESFSKSPQDPQGANQMNNYLSKLGQMSSAADLLKTLEALAKAKADALKGLRSKRSGWDVVRRKRTPEQRAANLVRIASKWNARFDANSYKVDLAQVAQLLESISRQINDSITGVGASATDAVVSGGEGASKRAVEKATAKIVPQQEITLADQFNEL